MNKKYIHNYLQEIVHYIFYLLFCNNISRQTENRFFIDRKFIIKILVSNVYTYINNYNIYMYAYVHKLIYLLISIESLTANHENSQPTHANVCIFNPLQYRCHLLIN